MEVIIPRFYALPEGSAFLFGPRGTGKSTFLKRTFPEAYYIDLLKADLHRRYQARPELLLEIIAASPGIELVIVDEIQKVPELLGTIHSLIEDYPAIRFIMTGSSARKLKRSGINLLAGRALLSQMHAFMLSELGEAASFEKALRYGLLPIVYMAPDPASTLATYIALYIREEVQYEGLVRNLGGFSRFLEAVSFSHGSVLNISNVARDCGVERKLVENYISILEDIMLAIRLPVFTKRAKRATIAHPKFYFFDTGVFRELRPKGPLDSPQEIDGASLEGLVLQHFRAWISYGNQKYELYFWRSRGGIEVDFVLYGVWGIFAFEVKNSDRIRSEDLRPLKEFKKDYPECRTIFLYRGEEKLLRDDVLCIPCDQFLSKLFPDKSMLEVLA